MKVYACSPSLCVHRPRGRPSGRLQEVSPGRPRATLRDELLRPAPSLGQMAQRLDPGAELPASPGRDLAHGHLV